MKPQNKRENERKWEESPMENEKKLGVTPSSEYEKKKGKQDKLHLNNLILKDTLKMCFHGTMYTICSN